MALHSHLGDLATPPGAAGNPVSALPANPGDGQEIYFQTAGMAEKGVVWHLRYRAASASAYKWELVGGPDFVTGTEGNISTAAAEAAPAELTGGPSITPPLNGDYEVALHLFLQASAATATNLVGYIVRNKETATRVELLIFVATATFAGATLECRTALTLEAGKSYQVYVANSAGISASYSGARFLYKPIRVG